LEIDDHTLNPKLPFTLTRDSRRCAATLTTTVVASRDRDRRCELPRNARSRADYRTRHVPPRKMVCGFLTIRALCA
jgi:hypothetical protein